MPRRILLVHPNRESVRAHGLPHLGLASLAAILKDVGYEVMVVDYLLTPNAPSITDLLKSFSPDIVGISTYTAMISKAFKFIDSIYNYNQSIPILVGGPHATLYPEDFLDDDRISYIFKGESEEKIGEIINSAIQEHLPKVIDCLPVDVKRIPFPDFTCFYGFEKIQDYPLVTTRGCPYQCSFCMVKFISSRRYRCKEISTCCKEIMHARMTLPALQAVSIIDDNCAVLKDHFRNFLLEYIEKIDLPLGFAYIRADAINDEILTLIKRAGTKSVCIAVEHGHPEVYKHINKGEKLDDIIKAAHLVRKRGFGLELCFIIGLPYDTFEMTKYNVKIAKHLKASRIYWNMLVPYKGTEAREWFLKNGMLFGEADRTSHVDYSCFCDEPAMETKEMTAEDRKKAYFYAMLETNNYVLRMQDIFKDVPKLLIAAHKYGLYKTLIKNLIFQFLHLPSRLKARIQRLANKEQFYAKTKSNLQLKLFSLCKKQLDIHLKLFNKIPAFLRFYHLIYRLLKPKGFISARIQGNLMYIDAKDEIMAPELLVYGIYERYETELFNRIVKPGMVIFDIGANIGYYSLIAARLVGESGRVYAFEPYPHNYTILISNIKANNFGKIIMPIEKLVLDRCAKSRLFIDDSNTVTHSISQENIQIKKGGFIEQETVTIDNFFENFSSRRVDLMKIDVEGAEDSVIRGAEETIRFNSNLKIIMEFWPEGLRNCGTEPGDLPLRLKMYGFKIKVILDGAMIETGNTNKIMEMMRNKKSITLFLEKQ